MNYSQYLVRKKTEAIRTDSMIKALRERVAWIASNTTENISSDKKIDNSKEKSISCLKCGKPTHREYAVYCTNCGEKIS